jgi:hypothetical protein
MGWTETCAVDERMRFVIAAEKQGDTFAAVCRQLVEFLSGLRRLQMRRIDFM